MTCFFCRNARWLPTNSVPTLLRCPYCNPSAVDACARSAAEALQGDRGEYGSAEELHVECRLEGAAWRKACIAYAQVIQEAWEFDGLYHGAECICCADRSKELDEIKAWARPMPQDAAIAAE